MASIRDVDRREPAGRGFAFPLDVSSTGSVKWSVPLGNVTTEDRRKAIGQRIKHVLLTVVGQRPLRRGYGTDVAGELFGVPSMGRAAMILREAQDAVRIWVPGAEITDAKADVDQEDGVITFRMHWAMVAFGLAGEAVVPFGSSTSEGAGG